MFENCKSLITIDLSVLNTNSVINMKSMFSGCSSLNYIAFSNNQDSSFDSSSVTNMDYMFNGCQSFSSLDLNNLSTDSVVSMKNMFSYCTSLTSIDISTFITSHVTNMMSLFKGCYNILTINLNNIDTISVENMNSMFEGCAFLSSIDLGHFNTEKVNDMGHMFSGCSSLRKINLDNFGFNSGTAIDYMFSGCLLLSSIKFPSRAISVKNLTHVFSECISLTELDLSNFDTSLVENMDYFFHRCSYITSLNLLNFDTKNVKTMEHMFSECNSLVYLDMSKTNFDTKSVTIMNGMFYGCHALEDLDITHFDTKNVIDMAFMFYKLRSVKNLTISNFDTGKVEFMYHMFEDCESLEYLDLSHFKTNKIKSLDGLFSGCSSLQWIDISQFETTIVTSMNYLFNGTSSLTSLDLSNFDTSNVISMNHMFSGCSSLPNLTLSSNFHTENVISMEYLFHGCSLIDKLDLSNFDTSKVTNMGHMFSNCSNLYSLDISYFLTPSVLSMTYMFANCSSIEEIDFSNFNTEKVEDFSHMFDSCLNLISLNLANFDFKKDANLDYMFFNCYDLGYVNLEKINETILSKYVNIFEQTPENMIFCFDEANERLKRVVYFKQCSYIDCSEDWEKRRQKVISTSNECTNKCDKKLARFSYRFRCFARCPRGTYPHNFTCTKEKSHYNRNQTCNIQYYFMRDCNMTFDNDTEKHKFIINTAEGIMNANLYDIILMALDDNEIYTIYEENEIYQIYSLSNKKRLPGLAYLDLDECGKLLKAKYKLKDEEKILVFKIEFISPDFNTPIIEYLLFGRDGVIKLNLNICNKLKINHYIPKIINDYNEYEFNPLNSFYMDKCSPTEFESDTDLTIYERRNNFNKKNISLCESHCTYKGYVNGQIICECDIKIKFNSYLNKVDPYNNVYRFKDLGESHLNIWLMKCILLIFKKGILNTNIGHYLVLFIMLIIIIGAIVFYFKEYEILLTKIKNLIQETSDKINKKELSKTQKKLQKMQKKDTMNPNSIYDDNKKKKGILKKGEINSSDLISKDKINISNNLRLDSNLDLNNLNIDEMNGKKSGKTDNEMNYLRYETAVKIDKRSYFECYLSLIRTKQLLIYSLYTSNDFNSRTIKICYLFFIFPLFITINALFIDDSSLHILYISSGAINIMDHFAKILYATLICFILSKFLEKLIFTEMNILQIKKNDGKEREQKLRKIYFLVSLKCVLFFSVSLIILFLMWIYISSFCYVYKRTQKFLMIISSISFGIFLFVPFILNLIPPIFRKIALQKYDESTKRFYLYKLSQILQIVF